MLPSYHGSILVGPVTHQFQGWALCGCREPAPVLYLGQGVRLLVQNLLPVKESLPLEPHCWGLGKAPQSVSTLGCGGVEAGWGYNTQARFLRSTSEGLGLQGTVTPG